MAEMKKEFPSSVPPAILTFSFEEIIDGKGTIKFFASTHQEGATESPYLTTQQTKSQSTSFSAQATSASSGEDVIELDFDATFNAARRIKGVVNVIGTMGHRTLFTTGQDGTFYITVKVRHFGTSESELASANSKPITFPTSCSIGTVTSQSFNMLIDVPQTLFGVGETLRITVLLHVVSRGGNTTRVGFGIDPSKREDIENNQGTQIIENEDDTTFQVNVPTIIPR